MKDVAGRRDLSTQSIEPNMLKIKTVKVVNIVHKTPAATVIAEAFLLNHIILMKFTRARLQTVDNSN